MRRPLSGPFAATLFLGCGTVLLVAAFRFDTAWFDRHCALPCFWPPPSPSLHWAVLSCLALGGFGCLAAAAIAPRVLARPGAVAAA
ncbi:MAG: hypothetical protein ACJ78Y_05360, partial [Myxococcales bacterium]